jgi:hypothetical protein
MKTNETTFKWVPALALGILSLTAAANAAVITSSPDFPPIGGVYKGVGTPPPSITFIGPGLQIVFTDPQVRVLAPVLRSAAGPNEEAQFDSTYDANLSVNGSPLVPLHSSGSVTAWTYNKIGHVTGMFDTELLGMNLSGLSPYGPVMLRESPTRASLGKTQIEDVGGGQYRISSFFDVFTELSLDGGATWMPNQNGPAHMELFSSVPEPSTYLAGLSALGMLGLFGWRNRK